MAKHNILGKQGELAAVYFLKEKEFTIVAQNWRYNKYEIDIVAIDKDAIVFVEVKTRSSNFWTNPEDAVSMSKIRRIVEAADAYVKEYQIDLPIRFDILGIIYSSKSNHFEIEHIEDAFIAPLN